MSDGPLSRRSPTLRWVGVLLIVAITVTATVLVEHRLHGREAERDHEAEHDLHEGHEDHDGHGLGHIRLTDEARKNGGILTTAAGPGKVSVILSLPGEVTLNADAVAHVAPRVGGTAREVFKQLGDKVARGDVLAILDSRELAEITKEARASAERVKLAEANYTRLEKLHKDGIVAEKELIAAKQALAEARIEKESAAQMLAAAGSGGGGGGYKLVAPLAGVIIEKHITVGEVLKDDTGVFVIADLSKLWVDIAVYSKDLARISVGQPVRIRAEGIDAPASGAISFLGATARGEARATQARVVLDNPGDPWRAGLFVTAEVAVDEVDAGIVVPDEAVQTVQGKTVVFVEEGPLFEAREVEVGRVGLDRTGRTSVVEITRGLRAGERFAHKGAFVIKSELGKGEAGHGHDH